MFQYNSRFSTLLVFDKVQTFNIHQNIACFICTDSFKTLSRVCHQCFLSVKSIIKSITSCILQKKFNGFLSCSCWLIWPTFSIYNHNLDIIVIDCVCVQCSWPQGWYQHLCMWHMYANISPIYSYQIYGIYMQSGRHICVFIAHIWQ